MLNLRWQKCGKDNHCCNLNSVNLLNEHFNNLVGVYYIWHLGEGEPCVRVGQGNIAEKLAGHKTDKEIQAYAKYGLRVTWAPVSRKDLDGVESFLFNKYKPLVSGNCPDCAAIEVNHPVS